MLVDFLCFFFSPFFYLFPFFTLSFSFSISFFIFFCLRSVQLKSFHLILSCKVRCYKLIIHKVHPPIFRLTKLQHILQSQISFLSNKKHALIQVKNGLSSGDSNSRPFGCESFASPLDQAAHPTLFKQFY